MIDVEVAHGHAALLLQRQYIRPGGSDMDRLLRDALRQLRLSAAEHGYPLDHLSDAQVIEGIGIVSLELIEEGQSVALMQAGIAKVGKEFIELQRAGYLAAH